MSLRPGDRVEHFEIVSLLGQGGMGQVYVARDTRLQRSVALKIVQPGPDASGSGQGSDGAARLLREAQSAAALEHPNVVTIYEVGQVHSDGEEGGRAFIAMELVRGRPLRAYVGVETVALEQRVRWLADVARALGAAHRAGLVHRDVKPENVMVREDGAIKVLDFGVAKRAQTPSISSSTSTEAQVLPSLTAKGVAVGTPYYMAPEQMRREGLDGRADQFSWGVVAYELLSGTPPWGREVDALELVSKLLTENPRPLHEVAPAIPESVSDVIARAMTKRRDGRFATMDELLTALGEGIVATSAPVQPAPRVSLVPSGSDRHAQPHAATLLAAEAPTPLAARPRSKRRTLAWTAGALIAASGAAWLAVRARSKPIASVVADSAAAPAPECTRATECVAKLGGQPAVCNAAGKCALVESAECKAHYEPEDLKRDDTVWIGAMFPTSGPKADYGRNDANAVELARRDFAQASTSLRSTDGSSPVHSLAVIECDDSISGERISRHLVDDLSVPSTIGIGGGRTVDLVTSIFVPHDVLAVASLSQSPLLTTVPHLADQPRMVWRTTYSNAAPVKLVAALVGQLEAKMRGSGQLARVETLRVAVVRQRGPSQAMFAQGVLEVLRFNGRSALENGGNYREFSVEKAITDFSSVATSIADFAPEILIVVADDGLVPAVEAAWRGGSPRPIYVLPWSIGPDLLAFIGRSSERRHRLLGVSTVSTTLPNARFVLHYNETFSPPISRATAPNTSYDAFYLVGYAAYALGRTAATGRDLSRSISRLLPPGAPIDVGAESILDGFGRLNRGQSIDLNGTSGTLDFDVKTGEAPASLALICPSVDRMGNAADSMESGLTFDERTGQLSGNLRCP